MSTSLDERLHAIVTGRVQGVNFRHYTRQRAQHLGLTGWVCNREDGAVESVAEGPRPALEQFLDFLRHGPPSAAVDAVRAEWAAARGEFRTFDIRW
jgi:acylphosphatase